MKIAAWWKKSWDISELQAVHSGKVNFIKKWIISRFRIQTWKNQTELANCRGPNSCRSHWRLPAALDELLTFFISANPKSTWSSADCISAFFLRFAALFYFLLAGGFSGFIHSHSHAHGSWKSCVWMVIWGKCPKTKVSGQPKKLSLPAETHTTKRYLVS